MTIKIFVTEWCPHCKEIKKELRGCKGVKFIDCEKNPKEVDKYNIRAVPQALENGKKVDIPNKCPIKGCKDGK